MAGAIASTGKKNYTTPDYLLEFVRVFFRRVSKQGHGQKKSDAPPIDLDPCSNPESLVNATVNVMLEPPPLDPLGQIQGDGLTFVVPRDCHQYINPPFGRGIEKWLEKAQRDFLEKNAATIVCVPDTPDTRPWLKTVLAHAEGRCQVGHRPKFGGMKTGIPKTISFLYFGPQEFYEDFLQVFQLLGRVERPRLIYADQVGINVWRPTKKQPFPDLEHLARINVMKMEEPT